MEGEKPTVEDVPEQTMENTPYSSEDLSKEVIASNMREIAINTQTSRSNNAFKKLLAMIKLRAEKGHTDLKIKVNKKDLPLESTKSQLIKQGFKTEIYDPYSPDLYNHLNTDTKNDTVVLLGALFSGLLSPSGFEDGDSTSYTLYIQW